MRAVHPEQDGMDFEETDFPELWEFCSTWVENPHAAKIGIAVGILVIVMNTIVKILNGKMASFSRFKSLSQQQTAISNYHFFFILINTVIIPCMVSIRF